MLGIMASAAMGSKQSSFESIATVTTGAGDVSFTSIPSTYKHLQLRYSIVTTNAAGVLGLRFNSDTGNNYVFHKLYGDGTNAGAAGYAATSYMGIDYQGFVATYPNVGIIDFVDYASTTKNKTVRSLSGADKNAAGGNVKLSSGLWMSTAAITQIDTALQSGNTTVSWALYGIKG
jgi:hypothetical protein